MSFAFKAQVNAETFDPTLLQSDRPTQGRVNDTFGKLPLAFVSEKPCFFTNEIGVYKTFILSFEHRE